VVVVVIAVVAVVVVVVPFPVVGSATIDIIYGGFHKWGYIPQNGWFIMENPKINR
jgi:hypothetical protein